MWSRNFFTLPEHQSFLFCSVTESCYSTYSFIYTCIKIVIVVGPKVVYILVIVKSVFDEIMIFEFPLAFSSAKRLMHTQSDKPYTIQQTSHCVNSLIFSYKRNKYSVRYVKIKITRITCRVFL